MIPLGVLLFFFVPWIPAVVLYCYPYLTCLSNNNGLESLGYWLFNWGGFYSYGYASYFSPVFSNLTTFGVLLFVALPLLAYSMALLSPEIYHALVKAY